MKILKSLDPHYLVHRLATDQIVGVLAERDLGDLANADMLLADGEVDPGGEPHAHAEVRLRKGVRFSSGEVAVAKLGEKLDPYMSRTFEASSDPVWFHPLALVEEWEEAAVVKGLEVPTRVQKAEAPVPDEDAVSDMTAADLGAVARLLDANPEAEGAEELALIVKAEYDRRGLEVDESLRIFKGLFGYPAGKHVMSKGLAAMIPDHRVYVEPFIGSGAVLFAKTKESARIVVNDSDQDVSEAWDALANLSTRQLKKIQGMDWTGSKQTYKLVRESKPSSPAEKLYRFLYMAKFSFGRNRGSGFANDLEGKTATMPAKLEKLSPLVAGAKVYSDDYERVCRKYDSPDTFFFFDPPYAGYSNGVGEKDFDEERFFKMLKSLEGKWLLTYGARGDLPGLLRSSESTVKRWDITRAIRNNPGDSGEKKLGQFVAHNYDLPTEESADAEKAEWSTKYKNDLPDSSFLYIAPGGEKDGEGKTVPRTLRYFPVRDADGKVDEAHARNAIQQIPKSTADGLSADDKDRLQAEARRLLEETKKKLSEPATVEKEGPAKVLCFYHADLDGVASAVAVRQAHPDAELVKINYGEGFDWESIKGRETVFMVDYGMQPFDEMVRLKEELEKQGSQFIWIDHHVTALEAAEKAGFEADGIRKVGEAGCELTWKFLNPDQPMPEVVRLAGRFDVWDHADPNVLPVHYAMEAIAEANDPNSSWWQEWLGKGKGEFAELVEQGQAIGAWLTEFSAGSIRFAAFDIEFAGLKCMAACTSLPGSIPFDSYKEEDYEAAISFCFAPRGGWHVSMYALQDGVDVGSVCDANGGGGHAGVGGFQAKELPFELPIATAKASIDAAAALEAAAPSDSDIFDGVNELLEGYATEEKVSAGLGVCPKWNGRLALVQTSGGNATVAVVGAEGDQAEALPNIAADAAKIGAGAALVGDVVEEADLGAVFMVRDVLAWDGKDLSADPWEARQKIVSQVGAHASLAPSPVRLVYSQDKLKAAIKWASEIPGAVGVIVNVADSKASARALAEVKTPRIVNALVVGADPAADPGEGSQTTFVCAAGPLSESEAGRMKDVIEFDGRKYTPVGSTDPSSVAATEGDVLRLEVGEILLVDSEDSAAIGWDTSKVLERVHVKPATVSEIRALARPHEIQKLCKILKRDPERHYILSVVLEPNDGEDGAPLDPDAHREIYSEDEVWDACTYWYEQGSSLGVMHQREASKTEMLPVHNFVAPVDMEIDGELVRAGTWLIGSLVLSAALWQRIESGELNAWSVDGRALRRPEAIAA
jgi:site-specific DNA-adenine methylase